MPTTLLMSAPVIGGLAGIVLATTSGWFITGFAFHRFQRLTPATWRPESGRQHALAVLWAALAGSAVATLESRLPNAHQFASACRFALLVWVAIAAVLATVASYVNLHRAVVLGLLLEWLVFVMGTALTACWWAVSD